MDKKIKKRGFTLAEMVISVGILCIVGVYIIQMFIATENLSTKSYEIDQSVRISKNIIELISSGEKIGSSSNELLAKMTKENGNYTLNLDKDFVVTDGNNPFYKLNMSIDTNDGLNNINIRVERLKKYLLKNDDNIEISNISATKMVN